LIGFTERETMNQHHIFGYHSLLTTHHSPKIGVVSNPKESENKNG
jgi:hypothetical protein